MIKGYTSITIDRPASEVFAAISDITRTGEWSPECTAGRWVGEATGPAVGAKFEGDNKLVIAGLTLRLVRTYAEAQGPSAIVSSGGLVEVAVPGGSAAIVLGAGRGDSIVVRGG